MCEASIIINKKAHQTTTEFSVDTSNTFFQAARLCLTALTSFALLSCANKIFPIRHKL